MLGRMISRVEELVSIQNPLYFSFYVKHLFLANVGSFHSVIIAVGSLQDPIGPRDAADIGKVQFTVGARKYRDAGGSSQA
jgi:hypothetical protein